MLRASLFIALAAATVVVKGDLDDLSMDEKLEALDAERAKIIAESLKKTVSARVLALRCACLTHLHLCLAVALISMPRLSVCGVCNGV